MAITARINTTGTIGRATVTSPTRTAIAAQNFTPKPNVSFSDVQGVSTSGVQDGYTLIFNSTTNNFEAQPAADVTATITQITGGTF